MNALAKELNDVLEDTVAGRLFSKLGRELYFPKGIVFQSAEASAKAKRYNATIGLSNEGGIPMILPSVAAFAPGLSSTEAVSYAPPTGVDELRKLWKAEMLRKNPSLAADRISLPVVVPGLTPGISIAADLFTEDGTPVVVPDMYWDNYSLIFETRRGATLVPFDTFTSAGGLNIDGLVTTVKAQGKQGKVVVLLNFPNNPAGYAPTTAEIKAVAAGLASCADSGIDILALVDDAYFGLFYEQNCSTESIFAPLATAHPGILAMKVDGSTKEDFVWGFRVAFVTFGCPELDDKRQAALQSKMAAALRSTVSNSSRLAQSIMIRVMRSPSYHAEKQAKFNILKQRYETVRRIVRSKTAGRALTPVPFNSGYFMSFRCDGVSVEALRQALLEKGIGTINLDDRFLRVAYAAVDNDQLAELYREIFETADALYKSP